MQTVILCLVPVFIAIVGLIYFRYQDKKDLRRKTEK